MEIVFCAILLVGIGILTVVSPDALLSVLIDGSAKGLNFTIKLFSIYAIWLSILRLWSKLSFDTFLADKMKFLLRKIFPKEKERCYTHLAVNLSTNLLGMGGAGTPAGIQAISEMENKRNKVMLLVVNSTSIQLLPTTLLALRSARGATTDIILPTLLSTALTTLIGAVLVRIFVK